MKLLSLLVRASLFLTLNLLVGVLYYLIVR